MKSMRMSLSLKNLSILLKWKGKKIGWNNGHVQIPNGASLLESKWRGKMSVKEGRVEAKVNEFAATTTTCHG